MQESKSKNEAIRVSAADHAERQFVIHPEDDDVFVRTGKQVIESCSLGISIELWKEELKSLLTNVLGWLETQETVRSCYCCLNPSKLVFFFITRAERFDFDFADALVKLNSDIRKSFNVGAVEMHQIPWDEAHRFIGTDTDLARRIYGETIEALGSVAT